MTRAIVIVLDSVGIGGAPDASKYGDAGADTLGHIADFCTTTAANKFGVREGTLSLPHLTRWGLGEACRIASGRTPPGLESNTEPYGFFGSAIEISTGKDSQSGHWEIAGLPVTFEWGYFPETVPAFPGALIDALCKRASLPGILGNCHASGTTIIEQLGEEHLRTGKPICYTSADSVFQIAVHEEHFGLERLYEVCEIARELLDPYRVGRVIARPFVGRTAKDFLRTEHRRDYGVPPPAPTVLDRASMAGRDVISVGKIGDLFCHSGTGKLLKAPNNQLMFDRLLDGLDSLHDGGLLFANFVEFDTEYGHRRDPLGYAQALEAFDARIPELQSQLTAGDIVIVTGDHGCDPTWRGSDHTREQIPIVGYAPGLLAGAVGQRTSFADIGATIAQHLALPSPDAGHSFLSKKSNA